MSSKVGKTPAKRARDGFGYNFAWHNSVRLLDGWVAKCAVLVPFFGYALLFNDALVSLIAFETLTGAEAKWALDSETRLRLAYYGLIFLGAANLVYLWRRPYVLRVALDGLTYVDRTWPTFTLHDYQEMYSDLQRSKVKLKHFQIEGPEWTQFLRTADVQSVVAGVGFETARSKHGGMLRSLIRDCYRMSVRRNLFSLTIAIGLAYAGYAMLLIPSAEVLLRVTIAMLSPTLPNE